MKNTLSRSEKDWKLSFLTVFVLICNTPENKLKLSLSRHTGLVEVLLHWFLNSGLDWVKWWTPYSGIFTRYPLNSRVSRPQSRSWRFGKEIHLLQTTANRKPDRPSRSESLYRLRYPGLLSPPLHTHEIQGLDKRIETLDNIGIKLFVLAALKEH